MRVIRLGPGDEDRYREIRLRALAESPAAFASTLGREKAFTSDVWATRLADERTVTLLAVRDGDGVGTAAVRVETPEEAQLLGMWVAPEARGFGAGHRLIDAVLDVARERGVRRLTLWVTETNTHARALYERAGFRPSGERQPLPSDTSLMEIRLARDIGDRLADATPFPYDLDARLREQLTFLVEIDRLKTIVRQSPLASTDRRENDAEHSWHLAMMVLLLAEYAAVPHPPRRPGGPAAAAVGRVRGASHAGGEVRQGGGPSPAAPAQLDGPRPYLARLGRDGRGGTPPERADRGRLRRAVEDRPPPHRRG